MPCIKIDKPLVVYNFLTLCNDIHNKDVAYIIKFNFFMPKILFQSNNNPYKPSVLFVRHRQTVQTQTRRRTTQRLIRASTVCFQNVLYKSDLK